MLNELKRRLNIDNISTRTPTLLVDNKSAISLSENDEFHERTKYIDIAYYFTRDCVTSNLISVVYILDKL